MSNFTPPSQQIERNPLTHRRHRREVFWQITLPALFGIAIAVALMVFASMGATDHSRWADISLIWLVAPMLVVCLVGIALVGGMAYGVVKLVQVLPTYARQAQDFFVLVSAQTRRLGDRAVEPVVRLRAFQASVDALLHKAKRKG